MSFWAGCANFLTILGGRGSQGVLSNKEVGGLGPHIKFGGKIWARSGQVHKIGGKIWEVLSPKDAKVGKSPNFRVMSEIQRAKFGVLVIYIFGGKIWGSNKNFRGKIWGQAPRSPNMEVPPWGGDPVRAILGVIQFLYLNSNMSLTISRNA